MTDATSDEALAATRRFYTRLGRGYDRLARSGVVRPYRERLADAVALEPGDTVVDVGAGTGANVPILRDRVGPDGTVVGIDVTPGLLVIATERHGGTAAFVQGDAMGLPLTGPVDAIVGSFVSGMVTDPVALVDHWVDLVGPGGAIGLLEVAPRTTGGSVLDELARVGFRAGATPGTADRYGRPPETVLFERVGAAADAVHERTRTSETETFLGGFVRLTVGRV